MSAIAIDLDLLKAFENGLDPRHPEKSAIPARVLGYGEISTVLEIGSGSGLAYKRLPMFESEEEAAAYEALYRKYVRALSERAGLRVAASETCGFLSDAGRVVLYIVQERFDTACIGHHLIHRLAPEGVRQLVLAVLTEAHKVFAFNRENRGALEMGLDTQISNWALPDAGSPPVYFDTSTPLMRENGQERLDPQLFLRSAPSFLVWVIRLLFLDEVMTRYYDFRRVTKDLIANFYKEQRPELVPLLVETANEFLAARLDDWQPLSEKEVRGYYREDAFIWRFYLAARKIDRRLRRALGREYPYILPEKVAR